MSKVISDRMAYWRSYPDIFVEECFGVVPDQWQREVLQAFRHNQRLAMKASKGVGKSAVLAWMIWNFLLTRPTPKIAVTSITSDNLSNGLWAELAYWQTKSPLLTELFTFTKTRIFSKQRPDTWFCAARSWSKSASSNDVGNTLAGLHADYIMFVLDESGGMPEAIMASAEAALSSCVEGHIVQAGNPTHLEGPLYNACTRERSLWHITEISSDPDDPKRSTRVSVQWAREQIEKYGRDNPFVLVNVFGQFPPASFNALIGPDEVRDAMKRYYRESEYMDSARIISVDVSRFGDDQSVITQRQGLMMLPQIKLRGLDGTQGAGIISRKWNEWEADGCFVDDTGGFGSSWIDNLRRLGHSPIGVHFNSKPIDGRYFNKRAEMAFKFIEWIKGGGALPHDERMVDSLSQTSYTFKGDKLMLEPKESVKEKLGYSPDEMDSACFIAGTKISTPNGGVDIEKLAIGDWVDTPFGASRVGKLWVTETDSLTTATFSNGSVLCGKGEHKIFVFGSGQCRLDALSLTDVATVRGKVLWGVLQKVLFTMGSNIQFKPLVDIIRAESSVTARAFFIAIFGLIILEKYQRICMFITKMRIGATTIFPTLASCTIPTMQSTIGMSGVRMKNGWRIAEGEWTLLECMHQNGMEHRKEGSGIARMRKGHGKICQLKSSNVSGVAKIMKLIGRIQNIVQGHAIKQLWLRPIILLKGYASGVAKSLLPIGIKKLNVALIYAPIRKGAKKMLSMLPLGIVLTAIKSLRRNMQIGMRNTVATNVTTESVPPIKVYNLTLEKHNAYYANDILVYNCLSFSEDLAKREVSVFDKFNMGSRHKSGFDVFSSIRPAAPSNSSTRVHRF